MRFKIKVITEYRAVELENRELKELRRQLVVGVAPAFIVQRQRRQAALVHQHSQMSRFTAIRVLPLVVSAAENASHCRRIARCRRRFFVRAFDFQMKIWNEMNRGIEEYRERVCAKNMEGIWVVWFCNGKRGDRYSTGEFSDAD